MFVMTSDITIGAYRLVKPARVKWKTSVQNYIDTCTIELPRITYLKTTKSSTDDPRSQRQEYVFKEGDRVDVSLGYAGRNYRRFSGFIRRVEQGIPVKVECEGHCYELYNVVFSKTYTSTTVKQILTDVTVGTSIKLSASIPNVPLQNVRFKNATGIQVLEWIKEELKLAIYFNFDELFTGTLFGRPQDTIKLRIGWNTVKDDDFKQRVNDKNVRIVIQEKDETGKTKRTKSDEQKYSTDKAIKIRKGMPADLLKQIANRLQTKSNYAGYEGKIVTFLEPAAIKGMVAEVDGNRYPEKSGRYFIESVDGDFGPSGGRQNLELGFLISTDAGYGGTY